MYIRFERSNQTSCIQQISCALFTWSDGHDFFRYNICTTMGSSTPRTTKTNNHFFGKEVPFMKSVPVLKPVRFHTSNHRRVIVFLRYVSLCSCCAPLCRLLPLLRQLQTNHSWSTALKTTVQRNCTIHTILRTTFSSAAFLFWGKRRNKATIMMHLSVCFPFQMHKPLNRAMTTSVQILLLQNPCTLFCKAKAIPVLSGAPTCKMLQTTWPSPETIGAVAGI